MSDVPRVDALAACELVSSSPPHWPGCSARKAYRPTRKFATFTNKACSYSSITLQSRPVAQSTRPLEKFSNDGYGIIHLRTDPCCE